MTKEKTKVGKALQFIGKLAKGQVKSIPWVGGLIVDGIEMVTKKDLVTGEPKDHNKVVFIAEMLGFVIIISFLVHKGILSQDVLTKVIDTILSSIF